MARANQAVRVGSADAQGMAEQECLAVSAVVPQRLLLVAPLYAPNAAVGAKRFSFLSERFVRAGYKVETLTLKLHKEERIDHRLRPAGSTHRARNILPRVRPGGSVLRRTYNRAMMNYLGIPDQYVGWFPTSVLAGRRVVRARPPDVIVATGPPFTSFLTAAVLARKSGARLILDYRDPWTGWEWVDAEGNPRRQRKVNRRLERWVVRSANAMVFTTQRMRERFEAHFPESIRGSSSLHVLTNAFDDVGDIEPSVPLPEHTNIVFPGELYGSRRVSDVTDALHVLSRNGELDGVKPAIHVFGRVRADDWQRVADKGLTHVLHVHEPVDYATILGFMKGADVLYLPSGINMMYSLPFKLFDYLRVRRPVLAVTPRGSALAEFMVDVDCGELAHAEDPGSVACALKILLTEDRRYSFAGRENYTWDVISGRYMEVIQGVVAEEAAHRT